MGIWCHQTSLCSVLVMEEQARPEHTAPAGQTRGALSEVQPWNPPPYLGSAKWGAMSKLESSPHRGTMSPHPRPNGSRMNSKFLVTRSAALSLHGAPRGTRLGHRFLSAPSGTTSRRSPAQA